MQKSELIWKILHWMKRDVRKEMILKMLVEDCRLGIDVSWCKHQLNYCFAALIQQNSMYNCYPLVLY